MLIQTVTEEERLKLTKLLLAAVDNLCHIGGCKRKATNHGLCTTHLTRFRKGKDLYSPVKEYHRNLTIQERLTQYNLIQPNGCIVWIGSRNLKGYGKITINDKCCSTHKVAWELKYGPVPKALLVCHHCDNPPCLNVDHLFLGNNQQNYDDSKIKGRRKYKISIETIEQIRQRYFSGESQGSISRDLNVDQGYISTLVNFKRRI